jgi:hypothetical protein
MDTVLEHLENILIKIILYRYERIFIQKGYSYYLRLEIWKDSNMISFQFRNWEELFFWFTKIKNDI